MLLLKPTEKEVKTEEQSDLHFTMLLLKRSSATTRKCRASNLHFTMLLLKPYRKLRGRIIEK